MDEPVGIVTAPGATAVVAAPDLADSAGVAPAAQDTSVVNAGAQVAIMTARLPFLVFPGF